jgi:hypothetical protein
MTESREPSTFAQEIATAASAPSPALEREATRGERPLRGSFRLLFLYDVAEAIHLAKLREILGPRGDVQPSTFGRGTPQYVRFEDPPFLERCEPHRLPDGTLATCSVRYYAFGVVAVELDLPFDCDWPGLLRGAVRWTAPVELEVQVREIVRVHLDRVAPAVARMYKDWLNEMYLVVNLEQVLDAAGRLMTSDALLSAHRGEIARIVSGEESPLAPSEVDETLRGSLSYYPHDLIVVSSSGALVYDRPEEAGAAVQIVEYAKIQLLEFRYYDRVMNRALGELYDALETGRGILRSRWTAPRDAGRINRIRLDVTELTERVDNDIKFVSDAYYARVHRLASASMGVGEYRDLVDEKLRTAGELYDSLVDRFNEARSFVIELAVAILVLLDVILLLRH